ncbi:MAG: DUF2779 domain-containing protein [Clostridia bacterium]|nr:DUF2779 domain-containing protein [Clostridia bacterium]
MYLSKSGYVGVWSCPKGAWIGRYHPEVLPQDSNRQARFRVGSEVGDLARGLFGPYVIVTASRDGDKPDLGQMVENTRTEMEKGTGVICEASFSWEGLFCAVDLLRKEGDGWAIYEVKSASDGYQDKYIADVSYQKYVLEKCGVRVTGVYLVCIDTSYILGPEGLDIHALFRINDLWEQACWEQENVPAVLRMAERILECADEPEMELSEICRDCELFSFCTRDLPRPNVFDLYRLQRKKMMDYYHQGLISFAELDRAGVIKNATQKRQMDHFLKDLGTYTEPEKIRDFLSTLSYPLYFLDFETMQPAIPFCVGTHPYAQIPFQYSLHYIEREGGELKHAEFLAESGTDPRREIAEALCRDIPRDACVTAFNKAFECTRLKELAGTFPEMAGHLLAIEGNVVDLLTPFQKGWYYKKEMGGSFSIKSVLPAICPSDPDLNYHSLEGVHNGNEAMNLFPEIQYMEAADRERARENLLAYCRLDTLAMVKVWEELRRAAKADHSTGK